MRSNKSMYYSIASIFVLFTIIQIFYFAQVEFIPTRTLNKETILTSLVYVLECILVILISLGTLYYLPLLCIIHLEKPFVFFRCVISDLKIKYFYTVKKRQVKTHKIFKVLQVIRC